MPFRNFVQTYEMQRLILIILSSFFLMISCNKSKPKEILSEKTMTDLMTDVHLVDGYLNTLPVDSTRKVIDGLYEEVFEKYGIDSVQFKANIAYYLGNPIVSKELYGEVTKKLNAYENDYRRMDSLKNAHTADSIRVVQRYQRLKEAARKLILDVQVDTIPLTYAVHQKDFMERAGLNAINTYQPPLVTPQNDSAEEPSETDGEGAVQVSEEQEEVKPVTNPTGPRSTIPPSRRIRPNESIKPVVEKIEDKPVEN